MFKPLQNELKILKERLEDFEKVKCSKCSVKDRCSEICLTFYSEIMSDYNLWESEW